MFLKLILSPQSSCFSDIEACGLGKNNCNFKVKETDHGMVPWSNRVCVARWLIRTVMESHCITENDY